MSFTSHVVFGFIGKDSETRFLQNGQQVCNFSVAQDRGFYNDNQEWQERTQWYRISVWGKQAARAAEQAKKGRLAIILGTETTHAYVDAQGVPQASLELKADSFRIYQTVKQDRTIGEPDPRDLSDEEDIAF